MIIDALLIVRKVLIINILSVSKRVFMQRKIVKKRELEIILENTKGQVSPKVLLEQYVIPADLAGWILRHATYSHDDIIGKHVFDLGCGTGRLGIGAALLGAVKVVGIDIDPTVVRVAKSNANIIGVSETTDWVVSDIDSITGQYDTVLQNPPFGVRKRGADAKFVEKALEVANVVYSLHKSGEANRKFISDLVKKLRSEITEIFQTKLEIYPTFKFHRKRRHTVKVDLYRIKRR